MSKPPVAEFTRDNPCTKLHIWNCFRGRRGFVRVQVDEAKAQIGANAPRVMERNGRLVQVSSTKADYFELTDDGKKWLLQGFGRYLKNHPDHRSRAKHIPKDL